MVEFAVFLYASLTGFVLTSMKRNAAAARPSPAMMREIGWGLFSLSATLSALLFGLSLLMALGVDLPFAALRDM